MWGLAEQTFRMLNNITNLSFGFTLREPKRAEGPKVRSPGQAKRRPGIGMRAMCAPCKGKSLCLLYTFALTGRSYICIHNPGRRFACPGLGNCWAFSPRSHRARPSLAFTNPGRRFACPGLGNCWAFSPRSHRARPSLACPTQGAASLALD